MLGLAKGGASLAAIGEHFGISRQRVQQLIGKHPAYIALKRRRGRSVQTGPLRMPEPLLSMTKDELLSRPGNVYIIRALGTDYYKIGFSNADPAWRINSLRQHSPFQKFEVVKSFRVSYPRNIEHLLHKALAHARFPQSAEFTQGRTEWFQLTSAKDLRILRMTEAQLLRFLKGPERRASSTP